MKKELFLIGALAAVLISGCAVAGKNADDSNSTSIGTTIYDENSGIYYKEKDDGTVVITGSQSTSGSISIQIRNLMVACYIK